MATGGDRGRLCTHIPEIYARNLRMVTAPFPVLHSATDEAVGRMSGGLGGTTGSASEVAKRTKA